MKTPWIILLYIIPFSLFAQRVSDEHLSQIQKDFQKFEQWSQRDEGSLGETETLGFLKKRLTEMNLSWETQDFNGLGLNHSYSQNLIVTLPGTTQDTLLVAVPINSNGTQSSSLSLSLALGLLQIYRNQVLPIEIQLLFLGAERGTQDMYPMGSRRYLSQYLKKTTTAALYLDFHNFPTRTQLFAESGGQISPIWLLERVTESLREADLNFLIHGNHPQVFRFNLPGRVSPINPFFQEKIPALYFSNGVDSLDEEAQIPWIERFLDFFSHFLKKSTEGLPSYWDHQYLFFQIQSSYFILTQQQYLLVFLFMLSILLLLMIFRSRKTLPMLNHVLRNLWQIPLVFILLFLFLYLATLILQHLFDLRQFESLWEFSPFLFLGLKVSTAIFFFSLFFHQIRRIPLSRWSRFYDSASIFILSLMLLTSLALGLAFSFYFLWALVFAVAFSLIQWRPLRFVLLLGGPYWFIKAAVELFFLEPDRSIIQGTILDPTWGNIILTILVFPFLLQTTSFHFMKHQRPQNNERLWSLLFTGLWGLLSGVILLVLVNFNPFSKANPIPVRLTEEINLVSGLRKLDMHSPVPLPGFNVQIEKSKLSIPAGIKSKLWELKALPGLVSTRIDSELYLDRVSWTLGLSTAAPPYILTLTLESDQDILLLDCNYPFVIDQGGKKATIHVGKNPPSPLLLELTTLQDRSLYLNVSYTFQEYPLTIQSSSDEVKLIPHLTIHDRIYLFAPPLDTPVKATIP